jgi:hypothetical protein
VFLIICEITVKVVQREAQDQLRLACTRSHRVATDARSVKASLHTRSTTFKVTTEESVIFPLDRLLDTESEALRCNTTVITGQFTVIENTCHTEGVETRQAYPVNALGMSNPRPIVCAVERRSSSAVVSYWCPPAIENIA